MAEGPPLRCWELEGFRSIRDSINLELGQMNVLVGANSAGKSSLIQSILLAAQTLNTAWTPRPLLLNGSLVQLGVPSDCINESKKSFSFGFTYDSTQDPDKPVRSGTVKAEASFTARHSAIELSRCHVETNAVEDEELVAQTVIYERKPKEAMRAQLRKRGLKGKRVEAILKRDIVPVEVSEPSLPLVTAARFRQFLPWSLFETEDRNEAGLVAVLDAADQWNERSRIQRAGGRARPQGRLFVPGRVRLRQEVPAPVIKFLLAYLKAEGAKAPNMLRGSLSIGELLEELSPESLAVLAEMSKSQWLEEHIDELSSDYELTGASSDDPFDGLLLSARRFFSRSVRHLGPLREEPKPLYGLSEAASGDSVGPSGEYTAALLDAYGSRVVECPSLDGGDSFSASLNESVDYWLSAIGLLSSIAVEEQGKLGYEINLQIEGVRRSLDLTAVGVGVSQVLPVIVQGLVAPPGSLVMFEQPELHLHPDVQAAVADFCLALGRSGRQILLETHSEYLVNRIRLRAVEDRADVVTDLVRLFFVERDGGATSVRDVELTSYGGLRDWPVGFLDQSAREAEAIMAAVEQKAAEDDPSTA